MCQDKSLNQLMTKTLYHILHLAAAFLAMGSCREELQEEDVLHVVGEDDICFDVTATGGMTRSCEEDGTRHLLFAEGSDSLFLTCTSDIPTKGTLTTSDNLSSFTTHAYLDDGRSYFTGLEVSKGSDGYAHTGIYWPKQPLNFFANSHTPAGLAYSVADGICSGTFSYTLPSPDDVAKNDAAAQEDYVFAVARNCESDGGPVGLEFFHAFSAICFKMGSMPDDKRLINHIALKNVPSSGTCSFGAGDGGDVEFIWSGHNTPKTYIQTIGSDKAAGELINDDGIIFMMLPHTLADAELEISFTLHSETGYEYEYVISKPMREISAVWEANKKYTYTISAPQEVDVEVDDIVTANVKHDVEITNPGLATVYIRAAIVGAWVNERGEIISPWIGDESRADADGVFEWGSEWNSHWAKGSDGFYYHLEPVARDGKTWPLFDRYTLNTLPPMLGAVLELSIVAQGVRYDQVTEAWPDAPLTP